MHHLGQELNIRGSLAWPLGARVECTWVPGLSGQGLSICGSLASLPHPCLLCLSSVPSPPSGTSVAEFDLLYGQISPFLLSTVSHHRVFLHGFEYSEKLTQASVIQFELFLQGQKVTDRLSSVAQRTRSLARSRQASSSACLATEEDRMGGSA